MDKGHTVDELFTAEGRDQLTKFHDELVKTGAVHGVITPLTIADFADKLVQSPDGDPTTSIAGGALQTALTKEQAGTPAQAARLADATTTLERINAVPADRTQHGQPGVGEVPALRQPGRHPARAPVVHPRRHARADRRAAQGQRVDRVKKVPPRTWCARRPTKLSIPNATVVTTGAPILLKDINDYLRGGMLTLGGIAGRDHGRDPARAVQRAVAAACPCS